MPPDTTAWVLTDGKAGDVVQCLGVARALGLEPDRRTVRPRAPWSWIAPRGPVDPRERQGVAGGPLAPPFPDLVIASGRRSVPYLRAVKHASRARTFTMFLKDPTIGPRAADLIWVPAHDRLRGPNVLTTVTAPHDKGGATLAAARRAPDARLAALPGRRVALLLGGSSRHHRFGPRDEAAVEAAVRAVLAQGWSLMTTASRRTPAGLVSRLAALAADPAVQGRFFLWDGTGANPYVPMLALADAVLVTADSTNMLGEAAATGRPIFVIGLEGGHAKITRFIEAMIGLGVAHAWRGHLDGASYPPLDATPEIAAVLADRYAAFRAR